MKYSAYIFDFGGPLADIDIPGTKARFQKVLSAFPAERQKQIFETLMQQVKLHQVGRITTPDLLNKVSEVCDRLISPEQVLEWWNALIIRLPQHRLDALKQLREQGAKVYILSNTNDAHWDYVVNSLLPTHDWSFYTDRVFLSYEMHMEKPSPIIYETVIRETGINPATTLYIDDREENIAAGAAAGLCALQAIGDEWLDQV